MKIKGGNNKASVLASTLQVDSVIGSSSSEFLEGGAGNNTLTGSGGADTFVLRAGGGNDVITDFDSTTGDRILFDFGSYSDFMVFGLLSDGQSWRTFNGSASFSVSGHDTNGDGITDTVITVNNDSITLLGLAPNQVAGMSLYGG